MKLKTLHCPRCGAQVELDAKGERATCSYCGSTSYLERGLAEGGAALVVKRHWVLSLPLIFGVLAVVGAAASVSVSVRREPPAAVPALPLATSKPVAPAAAPAPAPVPPPPPPAAVLRVARYGAARLIDADGDQRDELLLPVEQMLGGKRTSHFAVFALPSGTFLRQTAALEEPERALSAVVRNRLLLAQPNGQLAAYDLVSGDPQWTTALGERVTALCEAEAKPTEALHVFTDDDRNLLVDVTTGRQTAIHTSCKHPLAIASGRQAPSDRRDYRAPRARPAYLCGGVRVMGSENYTVPDACKTRAKIASDRLEGMVGHAVWSLDRGALVFGVRTPGTYVPMVGRYDRGRWLWKSEVPASNPLAAEQGGPRVISLREDSLILAYASERSTRHWLTRFSVEDGARTWTVELPAPSANPLALVQNEAAVVVHAGDVAHVLAPSDGSLLATIREVSLVRRHSHSLPPPPPRRFPG